ncbi:hypothetical protein WOLCODRAFT_162474 [Wolfiporia cocos MD-104 SS10]|uniref:Uncharacterized protein n=1 Tax=Wolfiporia cocos (strain MD-104) TaxID=742152 RepID=A0A2H3JVG7_WOLCO|nr:hypothetical protein WOLCODRAFT_162474 [Wolfiporia cocos MD-104 SS10]
MRQKRKIRNGSSLAVASVPVFQDMAIHDSDDPRSMPHNGDSLLAWRSAHARYISDNDSMIINPRVNNMDATAEQSVDEKTRTENMSREESDTAGYTPVAEVLPISIHAGQTEPITEEPRRQIRLLDSGIRFLYESPRPATGSDISELPPEYTEH